MSVYLKYFLVLALLFSSLCAKEYPSSFSSMGTPLYKAGIYLNNFSDVTLLKEQIKQYKREVDESLKVGYEADDTKDKKIKFIYLKKLRKLQKDYDYIVYLLQNEIKKSIKKNDCKSFIKYFSYKFEGLLDNRLLRENVIKYYKISCNKKNNKLLNSFIKKEKLLEATSKEFFNQKKESSFSSHASGNKIQKDVYIVTKKGKNYVDIYFRNTNLYDVTVGITSHYRYIKEDRKQTKTFVLRAQSTLKYARLSILKQGASYSYKYNWIIGSKDAVHNDKYLYRLPYAKGTAHMVSQGFNGKSTHKGHSQYAVDFQMKVGTKIYAARGGIVVKTKEDSNRRGFAKKFAKYGNYITILHNDGTFGTYYHLKRGGVLVHVGERVERGYPIGYSGNTGYTNGPHLHFAVFHALSSHATKSLPIKFISTRGIVTNPQVRSHYVAK